jgi:hypothetical protein
MNRNGIPQGQNAPALRVRMLAVADRLFTDFEHRPVKVASVESAAT